MFGVRDAGGLLWGPGGWWARARTKEHATPGAFDVYRERVPGWGLDLTRWAEVANTAASRAVRKRRAAAG